jgi:hypothetical protein
MRYTVKEHCGASCVFYGPQLVCAATTIEFAELIAKLLNAEGAQE